MPPVYPSYFDADWYLAAYPDVEAVGYHPLKHYIKHGRAEGRFPCFMPAALRARDLRFGFLEKGVQALDDLMTEGSEASRSYAAIARADMAAQDGDWATAKTCLLPIDNLAGLMGDVDHSLLALEVAAAGGDAIWGRRLLAEAKRAFGRRPDLALAEANIIATEYGFDARWHKTLNRFFARRFLTKVIVKNGTGEPFDQLHAAREPKRIGRDGPVVSVVMPALNAEKTIGTALRSLLSQTWQTLEICVVDNGSTDGTVEVVKSYRQQDRRIKLLDASNEAGAYPARNIGAAAATGAFITVLDADDWAHPNRIARQVRQLRRKPQARATISDWVRATPQLRFSRSGQGCDLIHPDMSSLMIRAEIFDQLGYWDRARAGADSEYYERIKIIFGVGSITRTDPGIPLGVGRLRVDSLTQSQATHLNSQARRDYMLAAKRWHLRAGKTDDLPLPQFPALRPFALPTALELERPDASPSLRVPDDIEQSGLFDHDWYMRSYPDLRARGVDGLTHYLETGAREGRDPGPHFSTTGYAMKHGITLENALCQYVKTAPKDRANSLPNWCGHLPAPKKGRHILVFGHQAGKEIFGAERCLLTILDRAQEAELTPSVVLPHIQNRDYLEALRRRSHAVHVLPYGWRYGGVAPDPRPHERLVQLIQESGAIAVHQNTCVLDAPLRAAQAVGVQSTLHVHELPQSDPKLCFDLGQSADELRTNLLTQADRFVVPSNAVRDWLAVDQNRVLVAPNQIDARLSKLPFRPGSTLRVAMIGSLTAKKGIKDAVILAKLLKRANIEIRLIGPLSVDLQQLGGLPKNMHHMGYAATPADALKQTDVVLCLSRVAESFGLSVAEALMAGRPVICYDRGAPPELLGGDGVIVPPGRLDLIAKTLMDWADHPEQLRVASEKTRHRGAQLAAETAQIDLRAFFGHG